MFEDENLVIEMGDHWVERGAGQPALIHSMISSRRHRNDPPIRIDSGTHPITRSRDNVRGEILMSAASSLAVMKSGSSTFKHWSAMVISHPSIILRSR